MPESHERKNVNAKQHNAEDTKLNANWADGIKPSPRWWAPLSCVFMLLGLVCIVIYYMSSGKLLIPNAGNWNLGLGLGVAFIGFLMLLRWK